VNQDRKRHHNQRHLHQLQCQEFREFRTRGRRGRSTPRSLYSKTRAAVAPDRLIAKGYGESQPLVSNDTDEGRFQNRLGRI